MVMHVKFLVENDVFMSGGGGGFAANKIWEVPQVNLLGKRDFEESNLMLMKSLHRS